MVFIPDVLQNVQFKRTPFYIDVKSIISGTDCRINYKPRVKEQDITDVNGKNRG